MEEPENNINIDDDIDDDWNNPIDDDAEQAYLEQVRRDREGLRRQIETDDPDCTKLWIGVEDDGQFHPPDGDWARDGRSVGRNTQLKEVMLEYEGWCPQMMPNGENVDLDVDGFFSGFAPNRSIKKLSLVSAPYGDILSALIPFFQNNKNLELDINGGSGESATPESLVSNLSEFNSLRAFRLRRSLFGNSFDAGDLIQTLAGHVDLEEMTLEHITVGKRGLKKLLTILQNQRSKLSLLRLKDPFGKKDPGDECVKILAEGLVTSTSLRELSLEYIRGLSQTAWQSLFGVLQNPNCCLETLSLSENEISDTVAISFASTLASNSTLKTLKLCDIDGVNRFRIMPRDTEQITLAGWQEIFQILQNPNSALEVLDLCRNRGTNDDTINALTDVLVGNTKMTELRLGENVGVSAEAWKTLSPVLQNPDSALEILDLHGNRNISDEVAASFARALVNNGTLRTLNLSYNTGITDTGWEKFLPVLCNKSSIMATYQSNHTLQKFFIDSDGECYEEIEEDNELPGEVKTLLRLNRGNSKTQSARLKVIRCHFHGTNIDMQPFIDIGVNVLPHAVAWMGRGGLVAGETLDDGFNLLYQFSRNVLPTFLGDGGGNKKRKRSSSD